MCRVQPCFFLLGWPPPISLTTSSQLVFLRQNLTSVVNFRGKPVVPKPPCSFWHSAHKLKYSTPVQPPSVDYLALSHAVPRIMLCYLCAALRMHASGIESCILEFSCHFKLYCNQSGVRMACHPDLAIFWRSFAVLQASRKVFAQRVSWRHIDRSSAGTTRTTRRRIWAPDGRRTRSQEPRTQRESSSRKCTTRNWDNTHENALASVGVDRALGYSPNKY